MTTDKDGSGRVMSKEKIEDAIKFMVTRLEAGIWRKTQTRMAELQGQVGFRDTDEKAKKMGQVMWQAFQPSDRAFEDQIKELESGPRPAVLSPPVLPVELPRFKEHLLRCVCVFFGFCGLLLCCVVSCCLLCVFVFVCLLLFVWCFCGTIAPA